MRDVINLSTVWTEVLADALPVKLHERRSSIYVDAAKLEDIPAIACPTGESDNKHKLDQLYGHILNHVEGYTETVEDSRGRKVPAINIEVIAVSNLDEVANGGQPIIVAIGGDREGRRSRRRPNASNAAGVPSQQRQVTVGGKTYTMNA